MATADTRAVLAALLRARSSSLLLSAQQLTGDRPSAERLLHDALAETQRRHRRVDPFEAEALVRAAMARIAGRDDWTWPLEPDVDVEVSTEWRAALTEELDAAPRAPDRWSLALVVAGALLALGIVAGLLTGGGESDLGSPLPLGNAWVLDRMRQGQPSTVDAADHTLAEIAADWNRMGGAGRSLAPATDECDGIYAHDRRSPEPRLVRTWCASRMLSLSPQGRSVLVSGSDLGSGVPFDLRPAGMLDVRTGRLTLFPELRDLDQYDGEDLVGYHWEDEQTVVLAYLADRPHVVHVRCTLGDFTCEVAGR